MSRVQLALNVDNLDRLSPFYTTFFGAEARQASSPAMPTSVSRSRR